MCRSSSGLSIIQLGCPHELLEKASSPRSACGGWLESSSETFWSGIFGVNYVEFLVFYQKLLKGSLSGLFAPAE